MPKFTQNQKDAISKATQLLNEKMASNNKEDGVMINNERIQNFVKEKQEIDQFSANKNPLIKEYIHLHKEAEKRPYTKIGRMQKKMKEIALRQEIYKEAAKLCENEADKNAFLDEIEELNNSPEMAAYEKYVEGLKFLAGMVAEPKKEVVDFFAMVLQEQLPVDKRNIYELYRGGIDSWDGDQSKKNEIRDLDEDTKALNDAYQKKVAAAKARELFAKNQRALKSIEAQFVGFGVIKEGESTPGFRGRMAPSAFFIGRMLAANHPLEKILDPNELVEEKKAVGKEYLEHFEKKDTQWALEMIYENSQYMMEAVKKYAKDHKSEMKTEEDLVMHGSTFGLLAHLCFDNIQELEHIRKSKDYQKCFVNISQEQTKLMENKLDRYTYASGMGGTLQINYELHTVRSIDTKQEVARQLCMKLMLDAIQKDELDFENQMLSNAEYDSIVKQLDHMDEIKDIFGEDINIDPDSLNNEKVEVLGSMMSFKFVNDKKLQYHNPKITVNVKKDPQDLEADEFEDGQKLDKVVTANGKQLVETDLPAITEQHLSNLEKKNLRGKESGNSKEFNDMMDSYDATIGKMSEKEFLNADFLPELEKLKSFATKYIEAKRKQKGHLEAEVPNIAIDNKMLGKDSGKNAEKVKGGSIFTSRGKARYEFALKAIMRVTELESKIREYSKPRPQMKFEGNMQTFFNDDLNFIGQPIEYQNQGMEPIKENLVVESKNEEVVNTEVVNKEETVVEKITYDDETIKKAKDLLDAMNSVAEDGVAPYMRLGEVNVVNDNFVPIDFLVNDLKLGTEMEINQKVMVDVMKVLTVIISQEKTKEIEAEEIEAEFSLG